jgi:hypothetical protein
MTTWTVPANRRLALAAGTDNTVISSGWDRLGRLATRDDGRAGRLARMRRSVDMVLTQLLDDDADDAGRQVGLAIDEHAETPQG